MPLQAKKLPADNASKSAPIKLDAVKTNGASTKTATVAKSSRASSAKSKSTAPSASTAKKVSSANVKTNAKETVKAKAPTVQKVNEKIKKPKLVRDSFTMPESEYKVLSDIKKACLKEGIAVKKSELLRIGVALLTSLNSAGLKKAIDGLAPLKAGRPKKEK